jgi:hypothetical protein
MRTATSRGTIRVEDMGRDVYRSWYPATSYVPPPLRRYGTLTYTGSLRPFGTL